MSRGQEEECFGFWWFAVNTRSSMAGGRLQRAGVDHVRQVMEEGMMA